MLYLVGGPSRSGKTMLARKLSELRRIPYFCADYLTSGLEAGAPSLGLHHGLPSRTRGELAWPVLAGVLRNVIEVEPEYLVEGDALLPSKVASFIAAYTGQVRACFLGYSRCSVEAKCAFVRMYPSPVNDWVAGIADAALVELVMEMRAFSEFLEAECRTHGLRYFDGSDHFTLALEQAQAYLLDRDAADLADEGDEAR